MKKITALGVALSVAAGAMPAWGVDPLEVTSGVLVEAKQRAADGSTRVTLVTPKRVVPGDGVVVVLGYRNNGPVALNDIVLANPIPPALAFVGAADGSSMPEVSVDGRLYGDLQTLRIRGSDGLSRNAQPEDITHVRWRLGSLASGAEGKLSFKAILK